MVSHSQRSSIPDGDQIITPSCLDNHTEQEEEKQILPTAMPDYYRPPKEEDMYLPPGRKPFNRDELNLNIEVNQVGPPILQNDGLYR